VAKTIKYQGEGWLRLELTVGAGAKSGDVVAISDLVVDCITDADSSNKATAMFPAAYATEVAVTGKDASANAAVAIGDNVYKDGAEINKDATNGKFYGSALAAVVAGATTTILVARAM
jgi:hypothetical protein